MREYNRQKAVEYAHKWAFGRNPAYFSFDQFGGDCTNFASQVLYSGSGVMNYTPLYGWYYKNSYDRTPSWTGVQFLYNFLINNQTRGPFAEEVDISQVLPGDIIQLSFDAEGFTHSPVAVEVGFAPDPGNILIATHTLDSDYRPLNTYRYTRLRCLHIIGVLL